ncbi:hypothetical protein NQ317_014711 [Molorchus minor]|uniref:choline-phosphate cytidylyltransferase n=1 Tax=Molorchus minor TaxID=1323400 RepID=A0ABQ9JXQ3_9CUCU|nr:hypothetical protein NQ317_014711 [Molorchus minor]
MLDIQSNTNGIGIHTMSRKRSRSRSEEIVSPGTSHVQPLTMECGDALERSSPGIRSGVPGNEKADELARLESEGRCLGSEPYLGITRQQVTAALNDWIYSTLKEHWRLSRGCRQARDFVTGPDPARSFGYWAEGNYTAAPFSEEPGPTQIRNECDYNIKISHEMASNGTAPRSVRVYADGVFDLFHQGHARVLRQAKNIFPNVYLIVGVSNDKMVNENKGRTVLNEEERYNAVKHCRYVDEVLRDAPWEYSDEFLEKYKIDFVAHDDVPYASEETDDIYGELKKRGMFVATQRTEGVSTSDIVAKIVRDYDIYVRRNLARGYSAKELNVSYLKEKKLKLQNKMHELKDKGRNLMDTIGERTDDIIAKWEHMSREFVDNFVLHFFKKPLRLLNGTKDKIFNAIQYDSSSSEEESVPAKRRRHH